jgi:hydroxyacylglutathione hydrolase
MLQVIPVPAFSDNYIWLIINSANNQAACVDPGDATPVLQYCDQNSITLCAILITHHHPDHTGGVAELAEHYSIPVYGPAQESIPNCEHPLKEGDQIKIKNLDDLKLRIIDIPGHTRGHIAFIGNGWVFCGDTLFAAGCGRIFEGTPQQMFDSLNKFKTLDPSTQVFCGHEYTLANLTFAQSVEPNNKDIQNKMVLIQKMRDENKPTLPSTISEELKTNPFLRADSPEIIASAQNYRGQSLTQPVDVFATVREMKNNF